jgi:prefoldin subunit 5
VNSDKQKVLNWWAMIRWFMVVVLFSISLLHIRFNESNIQALVIIGVFGGIIALNLLFQVQALCHKHWVEIFQIVSDIVFATLIVHLTGGLSSFFVWVYLIGVITAALTIPQNGGLIAGLIASMSLLVLAVFYQNGLLTPIAVYGLDTVGSTMYILSYTGLFCGVAMIANYLSDQVTKHHETAREMEALRTQVASLNKLKSDMEELKPILQDVSQIDHDINTPLCVITLSLSRVKKYGTELQIDGLQKSNNEITDAVNKISSILNRLKVLKAHSIMVEDTQDDQS